MGADAGGRAAGGGPKQASDGAGPRYGPVSRAALLAGASAFALAALTAAGVARAACVPSLQTIATPMSGPIFSNGGAITVTGSGSISGGPDGVNALNCPITKLTNQSDGTISGGNGAGGTLGGAGGAGVSNDRTITTLTNRGAISGGNGGNGSRSGFGGAGGAGVSNAGTITTLTNHGTISGGSGGGGPIGGTGIKYGGTGIDNFGTITTLTNRGTISGGAGAVGGAGVADPLRATRRSDIHASSCDYRR
jgi:hypothetical protein